jgi:hypothetical protein
MELLGNDIFDDYAYISYSTIGKIPESKSNTVSFVKVEELDFNCTSLLSVNSSFICYSVTQKKNLLRVIHTESGDKAILRGHEFAILDLKFSLLENGILCSVDNGVSSHPHVIVWKKEEKIIETNNNTLIFNPILQLNIRASKVISHPSLSDYWAVSNNKSFAIFSHLALKDKQNYVHSYFDLPLSVEVEDNESITGFIIIIFFL